MTTVFLLAFLIGDIKFVKLARGGAAVAVVTVVEVVVARVAVEAGVGFLRVASDGCLTTAAGVTLGGLFFCGEGVLSWSGWSTWAVK